jgi:hypothetical protein
MKRKQMILGSTLILAVLFLVVAVASAGGAQVTSGPFQTYAAGPGRGYDISGQAVMVRTADGRTIVTVQAWGLAAGTTYGVHVHNLPCGINNGGGHYQHVVGGPVDNVNEIWPGFTTNAAGHGNGFASNEFTARPEAQSVVIHDTDAARIACADLN